MNLKDLTKHQKNKLFLGIHCDGYWMGTQGFIHKRTLWTVDSAGWVYVTHRNGTRNATFADIRRIFK